MACTQNGFERMVIKQGNGVPTVPATDDHGDGSWLETDLYVGEWYQDLDTGKIYNRTDFGISEIVDSSGIPLTLYTGDSSLTGNRTVDGDTFNLLFQNMNLFGAIATNLGLNAVTNMNTSVTDAPAPGFAAFNMDFAGTTDAHILLSIYNGLEDFLRIYGSGKLSINNGLRIGDHDPSDDNLLIQVESTDTATRPAPVVVGASSITSPPDFGMIVNNSTLKYEYYHPNYGFVPIGRDFLRYTINFVSDPLDPAGTSFVDFATSLPAGTVITKIIALGNGMSANDPALSLQIGYTPEEVDYLDANCADFDADNGVTVNLTSKRCTGSGTIRVRAFTSGPAVTVNTGQLQINIFTT